MSDGHLGRICLANHSIELKSSNTGSIHSPLYRTRRGVREPERDGVDRMLKDGVAEPQNTE